MEEVVPLPTIYLSIYLCSSGGSGPPPYYLSIYLSIYLCSSGGSGPPPYYPEEPIKKQNLNQGPSSTSPDLEFPDLPSVPSDTPLGGNTPQPDDDDDDIDFDDLTKRFEALKKKK